MKDMKFMYQSFKNFSAGLKKEKDLGGASSS